MAATSQPRRGLGKLVVAAAAVLALVLGATTYFVLRSDSTGQALALRFSPGSETRWHMAMTMDGAVRGLGEDQDFGSIKFDITFSMHVVSVDSDGTATIDLQVEEGSVNGAGSSEALPKVNQRIRVAKDGRLVSGGGLGSALATSSDIPSVGINQFTPPLPDDRVNPGDTWTETIDQPFPFGDGALRATTENELLRYEDLNGVRTAVIRTKLTMPLDFTIDLRSVLEKTGQSLDEIPAGSNPKIAYDGQLSLTMTGWFDPSGGQDVKAEANGTMDVSMRFDDFPAGEDVPSGEVSFQGTIAFQVERLA